LEAIARAESGLKERLKNLQAQAARVIEMEAEQRAVTVTLAGGQAQLGALAEQLAGLVVQEQAWQATRDVLTEMGGERKLRQQELGQLQHEEKRVARLRKEGEKLAGEVEQLEVAVAELMGEIAGITTQQTRLSQATAEYTSLQNEQPRLIAQMDKMKERIDRLSAETGGECPLCGQPLTDSHRQSVLAEVTGEGKQLGDQYRENKRGIGTLATEIKGLEQQIAGLDGLTKLQQQKSNLLATKHAKIEEVAKQVAVWEAEGAVQLGRVQDMLADDGAFRAQELKVQELAGKIAGKSGLEQQRHVQQQTVSKAEARLGEIERAVTDWQANGVAELANVDTQLQSGDFAVEARAAVARLQGEVVAVAYDEEAHKAVARERDGLKKMPALFQQLKEAEAAVEGLNAGISDLTKQIEEQSNHLAEVLAQKENEANRLAEMTADQPNMMAFEKEVFALRDEEIVANRRVIVAEQKVEALTLQRRRRAQLVEERAELTRHIGRLRVLEKACGRDGVQSLLIEQAIPEIEANANSLLDRLSDGKMSIYFETQKQLKSRKETVETLDIRIIDDAGERPYENFSGGEQFRVNFAVRLALSRLLARRAGARLQTLVIDEGFGSQDPQGRQRLVEAIHTVQEQFKRLLIITHVDELRDAFDTRIEVVKGVGGSQIAVS
jgi:exonuclease SbcC